MKQAINYHTIQIQLFVPERMTTLYAVSAAKARINQSLEEAHLRQTRQYRRTDSENASAIPKVQLCDYLRSIVAKIPKELDRKQRNTNSSQNEKSLEFFLLPQQ